MNKVLIIAEAGVNHNGSLERAMALVDAAAEAGADYVKFQTFKAEKLVSAKAQRADYQKKNMGEAELSQLEMLKQLELSESDHRLLLQHCKEKNIRFLSTAFDLESVDFLNSLGMDLFKIPSGEITNLPYLRKIGALKMPVILSTGMCVIAEIKEAMKALIEAGTPSDRITVLHCTTDYPTDWKDVNLNAMLSIHNELNVPVGYSDHTLGIEVPVAAVAMGATVIEKHFTLDKNLPGPDHKASLDPTELKQMVQSIRHVETALGSTVKQPTANEQKNMLVGRKSIHLVKSFSKGHVLSAADLEMKRPGTGISPMQLDQVIGKKLKADQAEEHQLTWEDLE